MQKRKKARGLFQSVLLAVFHINMSVASNEFARIAFNGFLHTWTTPQVRALRVSPLGSEPIGRTPCRPGKEELRYNTNILVWLDTRSETLSSC